jgi:hypothetical protein
MEGIPRGIKKFNRINNLEKITKYKINKTIIFTSYNSWYIL